MDKYEYSLKIDQMKTLCAEESYEEAAEIADGINWSKVRNVNALVRAGEVYENVGRYSDSREILLMAYDRSPIGRMIIYRLAEVAVKMQDFTAAEEYYQEFVEIAPHDNSRYILQYEIQKAKNADYNTLISILEEYKEQEYTEEWAYELAYLYHKAKQSEKCIEACDELILWFGDGPFVERALELKMLYQPLSKQQEEKYRRFRHAREGVTAIGAEEMARAGEYIHDAVEIPPVSVNTEKYNTVNLQEEIAKGIQQIMEATEKETVSDTMDNIKKIVGDIPYLQLPKETEEEEQPYIETDEEIDGSLKMNFQELLGEDSDGQMSLVMNEKAMIERQITGQMTISDVLNEWEKTRHAAEVALQEAEQRKLESAKARALQEAGDIMDRLTDVIPKLDAGVSPKELLEEEYMQNTDTEDSADSEGHPAVDSVENEVPAAGSPTEEVEQLFTQMNELLDKEIERVHGENAYIDQELAKIQTDLEQLHDDVAQDVTEDENILSDSSDVGIAEDDPAQSSASDNEAGNGTDFDIEQMDMEAAEIPTVIETSVASLMDEETEKALAEAAREIEKEPARQTTKRMPAASEFRGFNSSKFRTEELPVIAMPDDLGLEDEEITSSTIDKLTDEQKAIFSYFVPVKGMEPQLCQALTGCVRHLKEDSFANTGNLIIQGGSGCGKTVLATSFIKVIQKDTGKLKGRVGKIDANALNKKDIHALLQKVSGGCLIIEKAGAISRETAVTLSLLLEQDKSGVLVILEDTSKGIKKALSRDDGFARKFTEKIDVPIFTNDELVSFAKAYANELGYEIDEMAVLALYNRISNIQKVDQATTLTEVKEIVDEAIEREAHSGLSKAFRILTATRYTEDDRIILKEKNFE